MASAAPPLFAWPWEILGNYKLAIYGVLMAKAMYSWCQQEDTWGLHIFIMCMLRLFMHQCWCSYTNMLYLTRNRLIVNKGVDFRQIDKEWHWDDFILLQGLVASVVFHIFPSSESVPLWNSYGAFAAIPVHTAVSEPFFYTMHRCFHGDYFFTHYHSLHHSSPVPQPYTAGHASLLEHLVLTVVIGVPIFGSFLIGFGSIGLVYCYILAFDFLRCLGHSNVEIIPHQIFETIPFLKYILYTPSYHSLHHEEKDKNYCLFMPLFDALGNTLNKKSWDVHKQNSLSSGKNRMAPDFVFLVHIVDLSSAWHAPFLIRSIASHPYKTRLHMLPLWPIAFISMLIMWAKSKVFLSSFYNLRGHLHQTWVVPRFGFQYFLPFAAQGINNQIEEAILRADRLGVKVISLAALNKNEALNEGGMLFVNKHPNLKVRVVHGNTLTAAVILNQIPVDVKEVFLTGSTSKLGRAIALYLCAKGVRVLMLTSSADRFGKIIKEAPIDRQKLLVQVTKYQAAQNCKTWIVGKWITPREQSFAPAGTDFHQFVVPPVLRSRNDCTYGDLAAMRLPEDVHGLGCCEYTMERGVVHACHAGGAVHSLEGWTHHEVGPIDVDRIDLVWEAALKQGFRPVSTATKP